MKSFGSKKVDAGILIIDDAFPHPFSAFRVQEFLSYLNEFENIEICTSGLLVPFLGRASVDELLEDFKRSYPEHAAKIGRIEPKAAVHARLAYMLFLRTAYRYITTIEEAGIPFVFTLYPGGSFGIDNPQSDSMLKKVFGSSCFRRVIVTQKITRDYLIERGFCRPDQIEFIFGVVTPVEQIEAEHGRKSHFGIDKNSLDICFAAHKYTEKGTDKGYDIFVDVAKELCRRHADIHFHVVGGFDENVIDVSQIKRRITFHGKRTMAWFEEFYRDKEIFLSPNVPYRLADGAFDGFPTGTAVDAGLRQTAMFCTDVLKQNERFIDGEEIVIIPPDADRIVEIIENYYKNPHKLKAVAENGSRKIREIFSFNAQLQPRIDILKKELERADSIKKVVFRPETNSPKQSFGRQLERQAILTLTTVITRAPAWLKNPVKRAGQRLSSNTVLLRLARRLLPEFVRRIYAKLTGPS